MTTLRIRGLHQLTNVAMQLLPLLTSILFIGMLPQALHQQAQNPVNPRQSIPDPTSVYLVRFQLNTTSDYSTATYNGISPLASNHTLLAGSGAPGLYYSTLPGSIYISKQQFDPTFVSLDNDILSLRVNNTGTISISKGCIGSTTLTAYNFSGGTWSIYASYMNTGCTTLSFTLDYTSLYAAPSGTATIDQKPTDIRNKTYAFYYPWYGDATGPSGVANHWPSGYADHPFFGLYDSYDQRVIEAHIKMARAAGIDGIIVSWWGPNSFEDIALQKIFPVANALNFPITIYYESYRPPSSPGPTQMANEITYAIQKYASQPTFLHASGMPVVYVYCGFCANRNASDWLQVRSQITSKVGNVYMIGDVQDTRFLGGFQGFHWYAQNNLTDANADFKLYTEKMQVGLKGLDDNTSIARIRLGQTLPLEQKMLDFTVTPGFQCGVPANCDSSKVDRQGGALYTDFWNSALASHPNQVLITTWNEWHEGTEIEPSQEYGFKYIDLTRQYGTLYTGTQNSVGIPALTITSSLTQSEMSGTLDFTITLRNTSPSESTIYLGVQMTSNSLLALQSVMGNTSYAYITSTSSHSYYVLATLLRPGESFLFHIVASASVGSASLTTTVQAFNAVGTAVSASLANNFNVTKSLTSLAAQLSITAGVITTVGFFIIKRCHVARFRRRFPNVKRDSRFLPA